MLLTRMTVLALLLPAAAVLAQGEAGTAAGGLYLSAPTGPVRQATQLATNVTIEVAGIVARVKVAQRFRNDGSDWVEGVYVFPLPDDAAVDELSMLIGDRRIDGEIREREEAKRIYERARDEGRQASLVEQERPNLFTTSVANIAPGQEVTIEIGYLQTAAYAQGWFSLRFPMTLTPRFVPGGAAASATPGGAQASATPSPGSTRIRPETTAVPDAARITPPVLDPDGPIENLAVIEVAIDAGAPLIDLQSSSHATLTGRRGDRYTLEPAAGRIAMDRDFLLDWRIAPSREPRAVAFTETAGGETYALLTFLPPAAIELSEATPREMIFVIDTSGSMGGASISQAKAALAFGLDRLSTIDRFNVIEFNTNVRALRAEPVAVTVDALGEARRFVAGLDANGGTNMAPAIAMALAQPTTPGYLRQVIFITDGSVGNEAGLFRMIRDALGDARLFTVGIGSAPNSHFMRKAAQFGRGSHLHIARADQVESGMRALFDKLEHVALREIELDWPAAIEVYPERVPDLYRGEPVVVAARLGRAAAGALSVEASGLVGRYAWSEAIEIEPGQSAGVASIWARRKIEDLLDRKLEGEPEAAIRAAVLDVALEHGMLSPYTSLVAVDKTPERSRYAALRREALGNMLPAGSDPHAVFGRLPDTATDARLLQLLGTVAACLVLGLVGIWRLTGRAGDDR
jgi:Ca-activated chloride channel family protein